tara:strand:- start:142 stop:279 length:138 start_codon:yes stop_codon:yes gene_type:complete
MLEGTPGVEASVVGLVAVAVVADLMGTRRDDATLIVNRSIFEFFD